MQFLPIYVMNHNRLAWVIALSIGLVAGTVFTGLSVGLPIGLSCCKWYPNYTLYSGYYLDSANTLYTLNVDFGTIDIVQVCQVACNADSACGVFDVSVDDRICSFYKSDEVSQLIVNTKLTYNAYVKSNVYTLNG